MNPQESETEEQLRALRPRSPSFELEEKIGVALAARAVTLTPRVARVPTGAIIRRGPGAAAPWWLGLGWALAGAVTAAAIIGGFEYYSAPREAAVALSAPAPAVTALEHIDASAELVDAEDEGLILSEDAEPVRRVRFTSYERHVWTNAATGTLMEYTVPREDIRLTPVALQ